MNEPTLIRVCLNEDGTVFYFPWTPNSKTDDCGDYGGQLDPVVALNMLRAGTPAEFACDDPTDRHSHHETLGEQVTFTRI